MSAAHGGQSRLANVHWDMSWLTTASRVRIGVVALCVGGIVFLLMALVDVLMVDTGFSASRVMLGSAAFAGLLTFALTLMLLLQVHARREAVRAQLRVIGETNHHIRNALELIQFSAHSTHDQQAIESISGAVDRIQWVLRELLGETGSYPNADPDGKDGRGQ